jgi:ribose transport system permease protein
MIATIQRLLKQHPYIFTFILLVVAVLVNRYLQENLLTLTVLNRTFRVMFPTMLLVAGQTLVVLGGGIDLSIGTMMLMINSILVSVITSGATGLDFVGVVFLALGSGILAGAFNGFCVAYLRLQPIVTTYATGFVFAGIALHILPRPGGDIPRDWSRLYQSPQQLLFVEWPFTVYMIILLVLFWLLLRSTRYAQYLYATGSNAQAAYTTGVPVVTIRFSTYVWAGIFAGLAAIARTLLTGSANASAAMSDGGTLTLTTITAVVLGGTRLSGGYGGVIGSILGVALLTTIRTIISFANISSWYQDLVDAVIIIAALAGPGFVRLIRMTIDSLWTRWKASRPETESGVTI